MKRKRSDKKGGPTHIHSHTLPVYRCVPQFMGISVWMHDCSHYLLLRFLHLVTLSLSLSGLRVEGGVKLGAKQRQSKRNGMEIKSRHRQEEGK